jgi:hypothetical protein
MNLRIFFFLPHVSIINRRKRTKNRKALRGWKKGNWSAQRGDFYDSLKINISPLQANILRMHLCKESHCYSDINANIHIMKENLAFTMNSSGRNAHKERKKPRRIQHNRDEGKNSADNIYFYVHVL